MIYENYMKFKYCKLAPPIHLHIVYGCFLAAVELSSCERPCALWYQLFTICPLQKVCDPVLNYFSLLPLT